MKRLLLKIARWINKKYGYVIDTGDKFKFNSKTYNIVKIENKVKNDALGELVITSYDFSQIYNLKK
jgi:hypothetical protein